MFLLHSTPSNVFPEGSRTAQQVNKRCGPGKGLVLRGHSLPLPLRLCGEQVPRAPAALSLLLIISQSLCLTTDPHGTDEEAAALRKVGHPSEGSNPPLTRSSEAQRTSCYFWGCLRECRPPHTHIRLSLSLWLSSLRGKGGCSYVELKRTAWCSASFLLFLWRMCLRQTWRCTVGRKEAVFPV